MKTLKKIIKLLAVLGMVAAIAKVVFKVLNFKKRSQDYNRKAVCGGISKKYDEEEVFEKDSVASAFSGVDLDFKKAKLLNDIGQLDILGRFSGISVKVPDHWHVEMDGTAVQSGISKRFKDNSEVEEAPKLQINYDLKYCGMDVSNPKEETDELPVEELAVEEVEETFEAPDAVVEVVDETSDLSEETKKVMEDFEENFGHEEEIIEEENEAPEVMVPEE